MPNPQVLAAWPEQKVAASDGNPRAWFGFGVIVSGTTALIGAKNATVNGHPSQGAVYVFRLIGGVWKQVQKLVASDGAAGDQFGNAIALLGNTLIITAPIATVEGRPWQGAAYVFTLVGKAWTQRQKLVAKHGVAFETLGNAVGLTATSALISAGGAFHNGQFLPRSVYVFKLAPSRTGDVWAEAQNLAAPHPADETSFGLAMSVSGATAFVGARATTISTNLGQGAVYIYTESNGGWSLTGKLSASDGAARDNFGVSLALEGNTALIGAPGAMINGNISQGAVYRFDHSSAGWSQKQKFTSSDGTPINLFGASVSLFKDTALIGAYASKSYRGTAYVFEDKVGGFTQTREIVPSDGVAGDVFGYYTSIDAATALIGSYPADVNGTFEQGAAYFYARSGAPSLQPA
jgi:hypothetical protein